MSAFNVAVSRALRGYMADHDVTQQAVATLLERSQGYVSHRLSNRVALSLDIVDAVAVLTHESPNRLLARLAKPQR